MYILENFKTINFQETANSKIIQITQYIMEVSLIIKKMVMESKKMIKLSTVVISKTVYITLKQKKNKRAHYFSKKITKHT